MNTIKRVTSRLIFAFVFLHIAPTIATVCRDPYVVNVGPDRTKAIHRLLGDDVTDISKIKIFISYAQTSKGQRIAYFQSNYLSIKPEPAGRHIHLLPWLQRADNPTKILDPGISDLSSAIQNIIFWGNPDSSDLEEQSKEALSNVQIFIDADALTDDGRPPVDLSGVKSIRLVKNNTEVTTGEISPINLGKPPPPLLERLSGCCFNGRPPGRTIAIKKALSSRLVNKSNTVLLQFVNDSATAASILASPLLLKAAKRAGAKANLKRDEQLSSALNAAAGKTLIILAHIEAGNVVVESAQGNVEYSIPISELHSRAMNGQVNLILFGCNTIREADASGIPINLVGRYNTEFAARRIAEALTTSTNAYEFLDKVSTEGLTFVVQDDNWSPPAIRTVAYSKPAGGLQTVFRLFRVWFLGSSG